MLLINKGIDMYLIVLLVNVLRLVLNLIVGNVLIGM